MMKYVTLSLAAATALFALTGCPKPADTGGSSGDAAQVAAGKAAFEAADCKRCHGGGGGPDLTHAGGSPEHTAAWITAHIKNPKTHNQGSRMPAYDGKIAADKLAAMGIYLASLK